MVDLPSLDLRRLALHLAVAWSFAVAQPLYDVLRRNGEFFVAHRATPLDLVLFVVCLSVGAPLLLAALVAGVDALSRRAAALLTTALMLLLASSIVAQVMARTVDPPLAVHAVIAIAVGFAAAVAYARWSAARLFLTVLAPSIVIFPTLFLMHPALRPLMRGAESGATAAARVGEGAPPIVVVVFDQLPVTSLMDARGDLDRERFPGFAKLAESATWYRNATTVADLTGWALPPLLSGLQPRPNRLPNAESYPANLFTWLGGHYRMEVTEPITALCPESLCSQDRSPRAIRLAALLADSAVVLLHIVLPSTARAGLPPLTEDWNNFIRNRQWQRRWVTERDADRRHGPQAFIDGIDRTDPQPSLYFIHALLPHEPYVYLPSGQQYGSPDMPGLDDGRWTSQEWPVVQAYARHLLQVEYVDAVLDSLITRLEREGLYDQALVVVTSDHGVSFRPGRPFKGLEGPTVPDIMAVPLLVKAPRQVAGRVSDRNVQSVDVLPTIAELIEVPLTWQAEGRSATSDGRGLDTKTIYHGGAQRAVTLQSATVAQARDAAAARKATLLGEGTGWPAMASSNGDLIGQRVGALTIESARHRLALVSEPQRFLNVDEDAPRVPASIEGRVIDELGRSVPTEVAVAIGGVVGAVSRTYEDVPGAPDGTFVALVDPDLFVNGRNDIEVLLVDGNEGDRRLVRAYRSTEPPARINLASTGAREYWAVTQEGLHPREGSPIPHRWTDGHAVIAVPRPRDRPLPKSLRLGLAGTGAGGVHLRLSLNDCALFEDQIASGPWYRTFSLETPCAAPALEATELRVVIDSRPLGDAHGPHRGGVAIEALHLLPTGWPLAGSGRVGAHIRLIDRAESLEPGGPARLLIENVGDTVWLARDDVGAGSEAVDVGLWWTSVADRRSRGEQRMALPHTLYPSERLVMTAPLVPPDSVAGDGPWRVRIGPIGLDGAGVPSEPPLELTVRAGAAP